MAAHRTGLLVVVGWLLTLSGCGGCGGSIDGGGAVCMTSAECLAGEECTDGRCVPIPQPDAGTCVDRDGDGRGEGCALGPDCDDTVATQTGAEMCDGLDNDCDGVPDNGVLSACGDCDMDCSVREFGSGGGRGGFDLEGDENEGVGVDDDGALVLDSRAIDTHIIWIANTAEGTVSKVDTRTFVELARYRTGPHGGGNDPSRTSVNGAGDVYVGNRGAHSIAKISLLGAECPDTNGDGRVTTSTGPSDVLDWGQDDCVLWYTPIPSESLLRAVAAQDVEGPDGTVRPYVWAGAWEGKVFKLDGETGEILFETPSPVPPYGFALDAAGNLWISSRTGPFAFGRIDTNRCRSVASCADAVCEGMTGTADSCAKQRVRTEHQLYGVTVDTAQRVWFGGDSGITRYDPAAAPASRQVFIDTRAFIHGIAADGAGWVWGAGYGAGIARVRADDPTRWQWVAGTEGDSNKGMAVDQAGKIWSITQGSSATVITPGPSLAEAMVRRNAVTGLASPYTYSDMTGLQLRLATNPRGHYRHVFEGCVPGGAVVGTVWRELRWSAETPVGTSVHFRVRTAATRAELASATWIDVAEVPPDASPADVGAALTRESIDAERFLEVEVRLDSMRGSTSEVITPRVENFDVTVSCPPTFG